MSDEELQRMPYADLWRAEMGRPVGEYHRPDTAAEQQARADAMYRDASARRRMQRMVQRRRRQGQIPPPPAPDPPRPSE